VCPAFQCRKENPPGNDAGNDEMKNPALKRWPHKHKVRGKDTRRSHRVSTRVHPFIVLLYNKYRLKATVLALPIGKVDIGKDNGGEGEND
jgi:hypothetical protein